MLLCYNLFYISYMILIVQSTSHVITELYKAAAKLCNMHYFKIINKNILYFQSMYIFNAHFAHKHKFAVKNKYDAFIQHEIRVSLLFFALLLFYSLVLHFCCFLFMFYTNFWLLLYCCKWCVVLNKAAVTCTVTFTEGFFIVFDVHKVYNFVKINRFIS